MFVAACQANVPGLPEPVAVVEGTPIHAEDFRIQYAEYVAQSGVPDDLEQRRYFLDGLVNKRLVVLAEKELGIEETAEYPQAVERIERKLLVDAYTTRAVFDTIHVSESDLLEQFDLYASTGEQAERLHQRVLAGETFEQLAREVFADSQLANSGGSVGTFGFDEMDPAFENAAHALEVGEISPPVRTTLGYSVIQLEDRFTKPILTETEFAESRDRIEQYVVYRKRRDARTSHIRLLVESLDIDVEAASFGWLARVAFGIETPGQTENLGPLAPLVSFGPPTARTMWTLGEFQREASFTSEEQRAAVTDPEQLLLFIQGLIARHEMIRRARDMGLPDDPDVVAARARSIEDWMYAAARSRHAQALDIPEDSLRAYYEENKGDFLVGERVRLWEILLTSMDDARHVFGLLGTQPFEDLAAQYSVRPGEPERRGDLGYATREQLGVFADTLFQASEGEIIGPLEIQGRYTILRIGERIDPEPAPFESVRSTIAARLRYATDRRSIRAYVKSLRGEASFSISDSILISIPLTRNDSKSP
jgi:parvulin-like peptidyl-prolyl isomerase